MSGERLIGLYCEVLSALRDRLDDDELALLHELLRLLELIAQLDMSAEEVAEVLRR